MDSLPQPVRLHRRSHGHVRVRPHRPPQLHPPDCVDDHAGPRYRKLLFYDVDVVIQAAILTAVAVIGLFVFTLQSKRDFQKHYALLFSCSAIFMMGMFLQIVFMSPTFDLLMAIFGALLFCAYLVFDIDYIMNHSSPEDYIIACINLYLDIVNLFLEILRILNEINRN
ncbi:hypothetical protein QR680_019242 [Steinernema hermaphroditum]|uniref:Uncharacterized protein n=1 Tax=Steinernema hermaphroditum TaxID=289476 RepID=A0AA39LSC9_9BILA|nr:hypothetical protein QR680_019242 [Steinernema hermaphroditum]